VDENELKRKAEVAELLLEAARQFGESIEPQRVYERFHNLLADVVQHDGLIISSYDERDDLIRCQYAWTDGAVLDPEALPPVPLNREGGGMQSRVIVGGKPLLFNDVSERVKSPRGVFYNVGAEGTPERIPQTGPSGTRAAMMSPVKHEGRVVGVVQLQTDSGEYTQEQLELFDGLVTQMGAAVRTARLQEERRRAEAAEAAALAVAAEREEATRVLEAVGDGVFLLDRSGIVRLWNRAAWLMTGLPVESVLGEPLEDHIPDWGMIEPRIPVAALVSSARTVTLPVAVGGRDLWLSFVAVRSRDGVVYAFRDMTAERQLEEEKSDFVATISHELRTPMTAVFGAAQTLRRTDIVLDEEKRGILLNMIATQSARLAQITEEVLLTTQLERGHVHLERARVDIAEVVRAAVDAIRAQVPAESLPIELDVPADVSAAYGDADRLVQVLVNLLDNAAKYGAAPVRVRAEAANGVVRILVSDSGPGVVPGDRHRIFEKFFRSDPRITRAPSGTGLGLYISRELTRRMGGRLDLASVPGAGATFVVELPRT
jgi:signal transduction histidine kinase